MAKGTCPDYFSYQLQMHNVPSFTSLLIKNFYVSQQHCCT
uniref:Uncharacterized protein n=1 Tax=Rhizophora mucronata TaxID=61149 RepID=A0A2P2IPX2_RHIMU